MKQKTVTAKYASEMESYQKLSNMNTQAREQGMSYGQYVAYLTTKEQQEQRLRKKGVSKDV